MPVLDETTNNASSNVTTNTAAQEQSGAGNDVSGNVREETNEELPKNEVEKIEKSAVSNVNEEIIPETKELALKSTEEPVSKIANGEDKASASADSKKLYFIPMPDVPEEEIFNVSSYNLH